MSVAEGTVAHNNQGLHRPQRVDWAQIRKEYETTEDSFKALARRHGVSDTAVRKRAAKEMWFATPTRFAASSSSSRGANSEFAGANLKTEGANQGGGRTGTQQEQKAARKAAKKAKADAEWQEWFAEDCRVRNLAAEKEELEWERDNPLEDYSHSNRDAIPHDTIPLSVFLNAEGHVSIMQPKADGEDDAAVGRDMWRRRSKDYGIGGKRTNGRNEDKVVQVDLRCVPDLISMLQGILREAA